MTGRHRPRTSTLLLAAYAVFYLYLAFGLSLDAIVNGLLDDSFYYLEVARHVSQGLGSTFDGVEPTNGYHPLWMWLLVPIYAMFGRMGDEAPIRAALILSGVLGVTSLALLRRIATRASGEGAAIAALLLFAWPRFFGQTVNLLETGLVLALYLALLAILIEGAPGWRKELSVGLLLGLACLARLDSVFLVGAMVLAAILPWRGVGIARSDRLWIRLRHLVLPALMLAPYLFWNLRTFGHLQPISGAMKSSFPHPHWTLEAFRALPELIPALVSGMAIFALARRTRNAAIGALALFTLAALFHLVYTLAFMRWGVDRWHFVLWIVTALAGWPILAAQMARAWRLAPRGLAPLGVALGVLAAATVQVYSVRLREGRHLAACRALAEDAGKRLAPGSVVAATDAGVFAYFSHLTTVNLDGLINNYRYRDALLAGRFHEYLAERRVGFILDQQHVDLPRVVAGDYDVRQLRMWYRPEARVVGELELRREDEVLRRVIDSRVQAGSAGTRPNALIVWRYRAPNE